MNNDSLTVWSTHCPIIEKTLGCTSSHILTINHVWLKEKSTQWQSPQIVTGLLYVINQSAAVDFYCIITIIDNTHNEMLLGACANF